jgi:hypothetical protein
MKIKRLLLLSIIILSFNASAKNVIDLYGMQSDKSAYILKKYSNKVSKLTDLLAIAMKNNGKFNEYEARKNRLKTEQVAADIKKEFSLLYVDFDTVFYPGNKNVYTTIEVIEKSRPDRLWYVNKVIKKQGKHVGRDLVDEMIDYEQIGMQLMMHNQLNEKDKSCPVYHCLSGFNHPKLRSYLKIFNTGVLANKPLILKTLKDGVNAGRRVASAFLVGHFKNPNEIIDVLSPYVNDKDDSVRNSAIRVIGETMNRANISDINIIPFLNLLNSPYNTDRNKALYVLLVAAESPSSKKLIIQQGSRNLLAMLKLKQPNNHDISYQLLKKISGKNFGDNNIVDWEKWTMEEQNVVG